MKLQRIKKIVLSIEQNMQEKSNNQVYRWYRIIEVDSNEKVTVFLGRLKTSEFNIKSELVERNEKMIEKLEQNYYSGTAKGIYRIGYNGARFFKWMA